MHVSNLNEHRTQNLLAWLKANALPVNYKLFEGFVEDRKVTNNTKFSSFRSYLYALKVLTEFYPKKRVKDLTQQDLKHFISDLKNQNSKRGKKFSEMTIWNHKRFIRSFYNWLGCHDRVDWVKKTNGIGIRAPEKIVDSEDLIALLRKCKSIQEQAIISVLYDSACRASEFLGMDFEELEFTAQGCNIKISGKTGARIVPLYKSVPILKQWIAVHPTKKGALWVNSDGQRSSPSWLGRFLEDLGVKSGLKYRLYPHLMRKSRITALASKVTEQTLKSFAGWSKASRMASHYVFLSQDAVTNALAEADGMKVPTSLRESKELAPKTCVICQENNPVNAVFCFKCGQPLSKEVAFKTEQEKALNDNIMNVFLKEVLKDKGIEAKLTEIINRTLKEGGKT